MHYSFFLAVQGGDHSHGMLTKENNLMSIMYLECRNACGFPNIDADLWKSQFLSCLRSAEVRCVVHFECCRQRQKLCVKVVAWLFFMIMHLYLWQNSC